MTEDKGPVTTVTTIAAEIRRRTGINVATCYQCGKCSAGCPMASESALRPHGIMRLAMQNRRDDLLADESIWLCLTCETCTARCPNGCDPARVIDAVREIAAESGVSPQQRHLRAFHKSFLEQIRLNGRLYEAGFMLTYKMRSGDLLSNVKDTPGMLGRGKLHPLPDRIDGLDDLRRIFRMCAPDGADEADSVSERRTAKGGPAPTPATEGAAQ